MTSSSNKNQNPAPTDNTGRKRRSLEIIGKDDSRHIRSSSVSFAVMDNEAPGNSSPGFCLYLFVYGVIVAICSNPFNFRQKNIVIYQFFLKFANINLLIVKD